MIKISFKHKNDYEDCKRIPKGFQEEGYMLEGDKGVINSTLHLHGRNAEEMISRNHRSRVKVHYDNEGLNDRINERIHIISGDKLLVFYAGSCEWFTSYSTISKGAKKVSYDLKKVVDIKDTNLVNMYLFLRRNEEDGLTEEEVAELLNQQGINL
jgi:hypothetical protein